MLQRLSIKNYALINDLDIRFASGLTIITGETGAGKSIILGALSLILGQRAESRYFFNQEKKCVIEGTFRISSYHLAGFFEQNDLDYADETIIRREISADGKSRAFVNDTPVNLGQLKTLGEQLIDIHSQHATRELNSPAFQRLIVDGVAENGEKLQDYRSGYRQLRQLHMQLNELREQTRQSQSEQDYLQFQFDELDKAQLQENEQEALEQELYTLTHAEEIKRYLLESVFALADGEYAAETLTKQALQALQHIEDKQTDVAELAARLRSVLIELKDISSEIASLEQRTLLDENRLNEVNERLGLLFSLQKKHHATSVDELLSLHKNLNERLQENSNADERIAALEKEIAGLRDSLIKQAGTLFSARKKAAPLVEQAVQKILGEMGMPDARLVVQLQPLAENELDENGSDTLTFLFSANKGHAPGEMSKVASGGELSRLMLAVKSLIAQKTALPTVIFDEIDTGISGEVARRVGQVMENLAKNLQVITITHLPQIASKGKTHLNVFKEIRNGISYTQMQPLDENGRVTEVAKMLSGDEPTGTALQNARELLKNQ
ncbi:MAG: DNA repair protein RecN [Mucilaginibacter polytrichastri]|nr:DNA repair protein RecN [Mucilaginibacter polytrichastri]